jgi:hypothetical protein
MSLSSFCSLSLLVIGHTLVWIHWFGFRFKLTSPKKAWQQQTKQREKEKKRKETKGQKTVWVNTTMTSMNCFDEVKKWTWVWDHCNNSSQKKNKAKTQRHNIRKKSLLLSRKTKILQWQSDEMKTTPRGQNKKKVASQSKVVKMKKAKTCKFEIKVDHSEWAMMRSKQANVWFHLNKHSQSSAKYLWKKDKNALSFQSIDSYNKHKCWQNQINLLKWLCE